MANKSLFVAAVLLAGCAIACATPVPGLLSYPPSEEPSYRGGVTVNAPDGVYINVGPEPRFENTIFDGRTAAQKKADGKPVPTPPGLRYNVQNRFVEVVRAEDAPAPVAGPMAAAPKAAPKAGMPLPAGAAPKAAPGAAIPGAGLPAVLAAPPSALTNPAAAAQAVQAQGNLVSAPGPNQAPTLAPNAQQVAGGAGRR